MSRPISQQEMDLLRAISLAEEACKEFGTRIRSLGDHWIDVEVSDDSASEKFRQMRRQIACLRLRYPK